MFVWVLGLSLFVQEKVIEDGLISRSFRTEHSEY